MTEAQSSGTPLARLLAGRGAQAAELSRQSVASVTDGPDWQAVLDGTAPSPAQLRQLAPVLGLHLADLFVIAGLEVPVELAPADTKAGPQIALLVEAAVRLPPPSLRQLRRHLEELSRSPRTEPITPAAARRDYPAGPGRLLLHLLHNRNLNWPASVRLLGDVPGSEIYWSAATIGMVGHGRKEVSPELLAALTALLGISLEDLAALTAIRLPDAMPTPDGSGSVMAELIWTARRLTTDQVRDAQAMTTTLAQNTSD